MKAKRYMKPPSCRKPATVIVPYAGPALDGQRPTRTISEPRILSVNPGRKSWEGTKGTTSPCPHCWAHTPCHDERSHEGGLTARVAPDLLRLIARRMRRRLLMLNRVGCLFDYQLRPTIIQVRSPDTSRRRQAPFPDEPRGGDAQTRPICWRSWCRQRQQLVLLSGSRSRADNWDHRFRADEPVSGGNLCRESTMSRLNTRS